ncbi:inositol polyphosphate kinase family protein [Streptomyces griseoflavus]|uniref:inositol polyphosphate kinase family protein n=1 Tax=Streptomyces griseoflavus TaxID=35619 RepID=UPI0033C2C133
MTTPPDVTYEERTFPTIAEAEAAAALEGRRSASPEPNVNQGGHGGIRPLGAARQILEKPAPYDNVENEFYRRVRAGEYPQFTPVVPASYTAEQVRAALGDQLSPAESAALDDRRNIYIENITAGLDGPKTLDTKIGRSTTSYRENRAQQDKSVLEAGFKSFKFVFADLATGSTGRGWRVVAGSDASGNRVLDGAQSAEILSRFSDDPAVWDGLITRMQAIKDAAQNSDLGFVAASVFSVHGTSNGETRVDARLIDFAHAIDAQRPFKQSPSPSPEGSPRLGGGQAPARDLTSLKDTYRRQFISGMTHLIEDATRVRTAKAAQATMNPAQAHARGTHSQPSAAPVTTRTQGQANPAGPRR